MIYLCPAPENDQFTFAMSQVRGLKTDQIGIIPEGKLLSDEAGWAGERKFMASLDAMQHRLAKLDDGHFHVDLGCDVSTLYAAYYLIGMRRSVSVSVHFPPLVGGNHDFWKSHELLRRKLALYVFSRAKNIFVSSYQGAEALMAAYQRAYFEPTVFPSIIPTVESHCGTNKRDGIAVFADFSEESQQAGCVMAIAAAHKADPENTALKNIALWGGGSEQKARNLTEILQQNSDIHWEINFGAGYEDLVSAAAMARIVILPTVTSHYGPTPYLYAAMLGGATILSVAEGSNVGHLLPGKDAALYKATEPATFVGALRGLIASPVECDRLSAGLTAKVKNLTKENLSAQFQKMLGLEASHVNT